MFDLNEYELVASNTTDFKIHLEEINKPYIRYTEMKKYFMSNKDYKILNQVRDITDESNAICVCFDQSHDYIDISIEHYSGGYYSKKIQYDFSSIGHSVWKKKKRIISKNYIGKYQGNNL